MITIQSYLYPNTVEAQIWDTTIFTTRNRQMYSRPVTIYQGIDNPIQLLVKNQDQKLVNLTGYSVQADIQDPVRRVTVASFAVNFANVATGRGSFTIGKDIVDNLDQRIYKLTFRTIRSVDNTEQPVYVDDNYGVPLDLQVRAGYYSDMEPSAETAESVLIDGGTI